jgi:hypothetical protein
VALDPAISSLDELDASTSVFCVRGVVLRRRGRSEVIERHEERHGARPLVTRSCDKKKSTYPLKSSNNAKKSSYLANVSPRGLLWRA